MKKIMILVLSMLLIWGGCASATDQEIRDGQEVSSVEEAADEQYAEADRVAKAIIDSIGNDLMKRAKDAGYKMNLRIQHYKFELPEGWVLTEKQEEQAFDKILVTVDFYSPAGSAVYGNNTVDGDMLEELQFAVLDSGVFQLSEEDITKGKEQSYKTAKEFDVRLKNGDVSVHSLEINERAVVQIMELDNGRIINIAHTNDWTRDYEWDEFKG